MPREVKKCIICGKHFVTKRSDQECCGYECRKKRKTITSKKYYEENYKSEQDGQTKQKKKKKTGSSLNDIAKAAREAGMTYGQYVAKYKL